MKFKFSFIEEINQQELETNTKELNKKLITFDVNYERLIDDCYEVSNKNSGLVLVDKDLLEKQAKIIGYLIKKIGSNFIKGKSIMNISLPVNIFDKRTLLQVTAFEFSFAPFVISRAYYSVEPIEKLKWVTVFLTSQIHISPIQTKPFNPIIGETFQCRIGNLNYYAEQTQNKPPTWNFYVIDDDKKYKIYGHISTVASMGVNSCNIIRKGIIKVDLGEGNIYEIFYPKVQVHGLRIGKRLFNFTKEAAIINRKMNLACHIYFNPDEKGAIASIFSSKQKSPPDTIR